MSRFLFSWILLPLFPVMAEAQVSLEYAPSLKIGQVIRTEADAQTNQTLTLAGMPFETSNTSFIVIRETVGERTEGGGHMRQGEVETMQSDISLPGGITIGFNSNNPDQEFNGEQEEMIGGLLRASARAKWKATTGADHRVVSVEYIDEPFSDVHEYFEADTDPELIKTRMNMELARYPDEPVQTGDTWTRSEEMQAGGGQTLGFEKQFTYLGSEEKEGRTFDKVGIKYLQAELIVEDNPAAPIKVTDSELQVDESEGTLWYDRKAKRFVESREKVHITGTLTVMAGGMELPGELDLTIESKSTSKTLEP